MAAKPAAHSTLGRHILLDVWGVDYEVLNDLDRMRATLFDAAKASGATVVDDSFHRFPVQGLSGILVLAESHISVHTFPEHGYASFDIFTCGGRVDPVVACAHIVRTLKADRHFARHFVRGTERGIREDAISLPIGQGGSLASSVRPVWS
ncbi:MAG: adenosylmethionine decarboxylase [Clostridia bacterium]|nr:adenosylmethionine decarboxylase [Clostridia bacterium]